MATETANPSVAGSSAFDLQKLVTEATWRELLISLVESNQIDPWDIDIAKLVEGYMSVIKSMKLMDLRMPANFALAASILLKMKSDRFQIFAAKEEEPEPVIETGQRRLPVDVPGLVSRARMQPQRKVTLDELMEALDEAMKIEKRSVKEREPPEQFHLELPKEDIDQKMERTFDLVAKNADKEGIVLFGSLARLYGNTQEMLFDFFIPILFLVSKGRLGILQEEFFGDIFIKVLGGESG
jgi:chromatin segregation and condensation protein Rec8/ScpA/Scc1 (kleisin family)